MPTSMSTSPRRSGARTRSASVVLVALAMAGGLAACGDDDGGTATDPAGTTSTPSPSETPSETSSETPSDPPAESPTAPPPNSAPIRTTGSAGVTEAVVVNATEGGGSPSTMAMALDTEQAEADFVVGLGAGLPELVSTAVDDVSSPGSTPYGAVVSTGCEPPTSVAVDAGEAGFQVVPTLPKNTVQCFAPVTYVVVFAAPDA